MKIEWIKFYDEIHAYLEEDEKILWKREEIKNLLGIIQFNAIFTVIFLGIISAFMNKVNPPLPLYKTKANY